MGTIVVGVDGSEGSKQALEWAARQAQMAGDTLEIVSSWEIPTWAVSGSASAMVEPPIDFDFAEDATRRLKECAEAVLGKSPKVKVHEIVVEGHAALALVRAAEHADLLVVGSRGHGEFAGMLLGSVSMYVSTHAICPVVIVRQKQ